MKFMTDRDSPLSHIDMLVIIWLYYLYLKLTKNTNIYTVIGFIIFSVVYIFFCFKKPKILTNTFGRLISKINNRLLGWAEKNSTSIKITYLVIFFIPVILLGILLNIVPAIILMIFLIVVPNTVSIGYALKLTKKT